MPYPAVDLTHVRTYPLSDRQSRVALANLIQLNAPVPAFENLDLPQVADRIAASRQANRTVLFSIGAHVIKRGLSLLLIDLIQRGVITHLASNGAAAIHDFEIALLGATSEDVLSSLADGSFGMAEETGYWMNHAVRAGAKDGLGMGEALGRLIAEDERFGYSEASVLAAAYRQGIPYTIHVALGTDIIHQHPSVDFSALGWASGQDFKIFTAAVCDLEEGVYCNFGSAVIGPEVFLKAVSIARNLGHPLRVFTTANFDLVELGNYRAPIGDDCIDYYYRPRKNIVNRPVALGGKGYHIAGDHLLTLPNLRRQVLDRLGDWLPSSLHSQAAELGPLWQFEIEFPQAAASLRELFTRCPKLDSCFLDMARAFRRLARCFDTGGTLFVCGSGSQRISSAIKKTTHRRLPPALHERLKALPGGEALSERLQCGLRVLALPDADPAQELVALARRGDVLLGISANGKTRKVLSSALAACALGLTVISLTGNTGGPLAQQAEISVRAPAQTAATIRELHILLVEILGAMLEIHTFRESL